jgi:hypothetical protein
MDGEVTLLREVAAELRAVSRLVGDDHGPLSHGLNLARSRETWKGRFAEGFTAELQTHQSNLHRAADRLERLAVWLERVAADREFATGMSTPSFLPETR